MQLNMQHPLAGLIELTGWIPAHSSLNVVVLGINIKLAVSEVNYACRVKREPVYVETAREPIGFTLGQVSYELGLTLYRQQWQTYKAKIRERYRIAPLDAAGDVIITTAARTFGASHVSASFEGMSEVEFTSAAGPDPNVMKLSFAVTRIDEDGMPMIGKIEREFPLVAR